MVVSLAFVVVDLGRPDRFWHLIPLIGRFNWPFSMLTWDVLVLNGYLLINLHICGYLIYQRFLGRRPAKRWYLPLVFVSIGWAVSVHTVTAFLYAGLGGRPFWNSALLAPRFLNSAFVSAPALMLIILACLRHVGRVAVPAGPSRTLLGILRITLLINLFMLGSELFTAFYTGGHHAAAAEYLFLGLHGKHGLVPWIWTAIGLNLLATLLLYLPAVTRTPVLLAGAACAFLGVWIEKGMGLIVPGFIPSTLHEIVEYAPSVVEWKVTAGIWALGLMVFTVGFKLGLPVLARPVRGASGSPDPYEREEAVRRGDSLGP
jgi:molybdopterin-containing oxidoreductase family membrane subunit